ncbi:MAG TPA: hypothetical protein VFX00_10300 [Pedococcus sp.]|nr:hypothetical protein [Pedococcus sp.]
MRLARCLVVVAAVTALGGCVVPARDDAAYRTDAAQALQSATSETRTAELVLQHWLSGSVTRAYADTVVTDSEKALGPIQTSFGGVDPPNRGADPLREDVTGQLSDAESALAEARIALRRGDAPAVQQVVTDLTKVADQLEKTGEGLR